MLAAIRGKRPVLRAVVIFCVSMGAFYAVDYPMGRWNEALQPYFGFIAKGTAGLLGVFGYDATATGGSISSPEFSVQIVRGCDALEPAAAFVSAVLASPVSIWAKLPGIVLGTLSLLAVNLVRVASLFVIGIHFPKAFDMMHYEVWQSAFIVLAVVFWGIWVQWATRRKTA